MPYLDIELEYYDLSIQNRDATDDQVNGRRANAISGTGGVKCAPITRKRTGGRVRAEADVALANGTIRNILGGVVSAETIVVQHPAVRARWTSRITSPPRARRPVQGDDFVVPGPAQP